MGCPAVRSAMPSENAGEFCGSCLRHGRTTRTRTDERTASIVPFLPPFLLQIALDIFGPLSLSAAVSAFHRSRGPEEPLSLSLYGLYRARPKYSSQVVLVLGGRKIATPACIF